MKTTNGYINSYELEMKGFEFNGECYEKRTESNWDKSVTVVEEAYEESDDHKKVDVVVKMQKCTTLYGDDEWIDDIEEEYIGSYDFYTEDDTKRQRLIDRIF